MPPFFPSHFLVSSHPFLSTPFHQPNHSRLAMRPDETLPHANADPGQAPVRPPHPQVQSTGQAPAPKTTTIQQHPNANNYSSHHTQVAAVNTNNRRSQAPNPQQQQNLNQQQQQQQGEQVQQLPEAQPRRRQETEQGHHARKSNSSTAQSSAGSRAKSSSSSRQQQHSTNETSNYNFAAPMAIHDHLMQAAHHAQALQQRNAGSWGKTFFCFSRHRPFVIINSTYMETS